MSIKMQTSQSNRHELLLTQRLIMSAQMQQAIRLLQLPVEELSTYLEEQIVNNPLLEVDNDEKKEAEESKEIPQEEKEVIIDDNDLRILNQLELDIEEHLNQTESFLTKRTSEEEKLKNFLDQSVCAQTTLREFLIEQAHDAFNHSEEDLKIGEILFGYLDASGLISTPLSEIACFHAIQEKDLLRVLKIVQTFEPYGIASSSIQECFLNQLRCFKKEASLCFEIIRDHYDDLLHNRIPSIQKKIGCTFEDIRDAIEKEIAKLDIHPGMQFSTRSAQALIPDVTLRQENDQLIVDVERDAFPLLRLNKRYLKMLRNEDTPKETKQYIKQHFMSAKWLFKNLQERFSTIERIARILAKKQLNFFMEPEGELVPMTMKMVAEELELNESTVARTVANKCIATPKGLFPLRFFFTTKYISDKGENLSSATIKNAIVKIIENEEKTTPLSDEDISQLLKEKGIICARRTVAKFRHLLTIGNAHQRRKFRKC